MKIPKMLDDYLEETEQDAARMSPADLAEEARWVLWKYSVGEYYNDEYTRRDAASMKAFIARVSSNQV